MFVSHSHMDIVLVTCLLHNRHLAQRHSFTYMVKTAPNFLTLGLQLLSTFLSLQCQGPCHGSVSNSRGSVVVQLTMVGGSVVLV